MMAFARWKESSLHIRVCGPNSALNVRWMLYGRRANDSMSTKLCGCEVPDAFADGTRLRFVDNPGALVIDRELGRNEGFRKHFDQLRFGNTTK
jgi:hypothetical protein